MTQMIRKLITAYAVKSAIALAMVPGLAHAQLLSPQWPPEQRARFLALGRAQWSLDQTCNTMIAFTRTLESDAFFANFNGVSARVEMANDFEAWKQDDAHGLGAKHPSSVFNWSICKGNPVAAVMFALPPLSGAPAAPVDDLPGIGPVAAPAAPPATISNAIEVPFTRNNGGTIEVAVTINGSERAIFMVDSGASDVVIPRSLAKRLAANGSLTKADYLSTATYVIANGAHVEAARYTLHALTIAGHTVTDVRCSVGNDEDTLLLGQSFLRKFPSFSINNARGVLVLGMGPTRFD
jgi:clan AA aspartic protease (TIGR02281 family)